MCCKNIGGQQLGHTVGKSSEEDVNAHLPHVPEAGLARGHQNLVMIGLRFYFTYSSLRDGQLAKLNTVWPHSVSVTQEQ